MTTLRDKLIDGAKGGAAETIRFTPDTARTAGLDGIVGPSPVAVDVDADTGLFTTTDLVAGRYTVRIKWRAVAMAETYEIAVPDTGSNIALWPLIAAYVSLPPDTPMELLAKYFADNPVEVGGITKAEADTAYAPVALADDVADKLGTDEAASLYALKGDVGTSEAWIPEVSATDMHATNSKTGVRSLIATGSGITNARPVGDKYVSYDKDGSQLYAPGDGSLAPMPAATTFTEIAGWGSSTMQGWRDPLNVAVARASGLAYYNGGVGGQSAGNILSRIGTRPALIDAATIPASGGVDVTCSNMRSSAPIISIPGTLAGIAGTLAKNAIGTNTFTFTRTASGSSTPVPAGTPFLPDAGPAHRSSLTLINIGKNDMGGNGYAGYLPMPELLTATERVIKYVTGVGKHLLLLGHYVNPNTPEVSDLRRDVKIVNDFYATYGIRYVDTSAYLTGSDIWTHTGVTPDSTDLAQQALGNLPPSLSSDGTHMTSAASTAFIENVVIPKLNALGWTSIPATAPPAPSIPSDFLFDLSADYLTAGTADGAAVTSMTAQSGTAPITLDQKPTAGTYPTLKQAGPNGHASLVFPNTDSWISTTTDPGTAPLVVAEGAARTLITVMKVRDVGVNAGNYPKIVSPSLTPSPSSYQYLSANLTGTPRLVASANGGSSVNLNGTENVIGKWVVDIATTDAAGNATHVTSGAAEVTATGYPVGEILGLRWGAQYGSAPGVNGQLDGEIARGVIYDRVLTPAERTNAMTALKTLYGIA